MNLRRAVRKPGSWPSLWPPGLSEDDSAHVYSKPRGARCFLFSEDWRSVRAGSSSGLSVIKHQPLREGTRLAGALETHLPKRDCCQGSGGLEFLSSKCLPLA